MKAMNKKLIPNKDKRFIRNTKKFIAKVKKRLKIVVKEMKKLGDKGLLSSNKNLNKMALSSKNQYKAMHQFKKTDNQHGTLWLEICSKKHGNIMKDICSGKNKQNKNTNKSKKKGNSDHRKGNSDHKNKKKHKKNLKEKKKGHSNHKKGNHSKNKKKHKKNLKEKKSSNHNNNSHKHSKHLFGVKSLGSSPSHWKKNKKESKGESGSDKTKLFDMLGKQIEEGLQSSKKLLNHVQESPSKKNTPKKIINY